MVKFNSCCCLCVSRCPLNFSPDVSLSLPPSLSHSLSTDYPSSLEESKSFFSLFFFLLFFHCSPPEPAVAYLANRNSFFLFLVERERQRRHIRFSSHGIILLVISCENGIFWLWRRCQQEQPIHAFASFMCIAVVCVCVLNYWFTTNLCGFLLCVLLSSLLCCVALRWMCVPVSGCLCVCAFYSNCRLNECAFVCQVH